jgi:hypothetical protein
LLHGHGLPWVTRSHPPIFHDLGEEFGFPAGLASPEAERLIYGALKRAGRSNFSDLSFVQPLNILLKAYEEEADLSLFGRHTARCDVQRCLANLLRLDREEEEKPWIVTQTIRKPVFITGMPRSASTFLHMLLSLDPDNRVPRCWQLLHPYPVRNLLPLDLRKVQTELQLLMFRCLAPKLSRMHHLSAHAPQECTDITAQIFQSIRFENTHRVPSYQAWIDRHGHHQAFLFHKRFLQHLDAWMPRGRWILKSPDHVFALDAIRSAYPDAQIVFLHRDPLSVISSCAKLSEQLRRPFTHRLDAREVGRQVATRLGEAADHMLAAANRIPDVLHLYYGEVTANPITAVRALYRHCGLALSPVAEQRMQAFLAQPRHPSARRHDFARFGLDAATLRDRFAAYIRHFTVPQETVASG